MPAPPRPRLLAALLVLAMAPAAGRADDAPPVAVTLPGRVVELGTGQPVAGAAITVVRAPLADDAGAPPAWAGTATTRADADGRFALVIPPGGSADPRLGITIARVDHPDFIPRRGRATPLADLVAEHRAGASRLDAIALERGEAYTACVLEPDGTPAAGVPFESQNWARGANRSDHFFDLVDGRADADGRLRLVMPRSRALALRLIPAHAAPYQHFWGSERPDDEATPAVPADLGTIRLGPGLVLAGRLLDRDGRPLAGRRLAASGRINRFDRAATTDAEGRFAFAPLAPGNYTVSGADGGAAAPLRPRAVYLEAGADPAPLELRAAEAVRVSARFVDSGGRPARGVALRLTGTLRDEGEGPAAPGVDPSSIGLAAMMNDPEPRFKVGRLDWEAQVLPDAAGAVEFRAPAGLEQAELAAVAVDAAVSVRARPAPGAPLGLRAQVDLGLVAADRGGIGFVAYRAPVVLARLATEGGEPVPARVEVNGGYNRNGGDYGLRLTRQPDGRYRTASLLPDFEYEFSAWAEGYVPLAVQRLSLAEGATAEVDLVLRKRSPRPEVGDPAPPFAVATADGRPLSLADYRGRFLLIHVWSPFLRGANDLPRVDALDRRHGERLALLGLACSADVAAAQREIAARRLAWPQAILRDRYADPVILDYDTPYAPKSLLIGPDGTILARDLAGGDVEAAVDRFLGEPPPQP